MLTFQASAQDSTLAIVLHGVDRDDDFLRKQVDLPGALPDSLSATLALREVLQQLYGQSFLGASIDSTAWQDQELHAWVFLGQTWRWSGLYEGQPDDPLWREVDIRLKGFRRRRLTPETLERIREDILQDLENNGYPFARVWLDSLRMHEGGMEAGVFWDKGPLIVWEDVVVQGNLRLAKSYLRAYLGVKQGEPYNRSRLLKSGPRLRELPFLKLNQTPSVTFSGKQATLDLALDRKRASRFDFLIGILPNSSQTGRVLITGRFEGEFQNPFGLGERLYARFEQLRPQTQDLNIAFNLPYILELPFGLDFDFELYKRDTNYIDIDLQLGVQYLFEGGDYLKLYWHRRTSNLLSINEQAIEDLMVLPDTLDYTTNTYGLEYSVNQLDYRFNPRRGWALYLNGGVGFKTVRKNNEILNSDAGMLYDSIQLRSTQLRLRGRIEQYVPLFRRSTLKLAAQSGLVFSDTPIYANEQFRIGGTKILRGFDEELIFATQYVVGTAEFRLLLATNSYLFTFFDYGWVRNQTTSLDVQDNPMGFGAGIALDTKAGVFSLSLAYGKQGELPVDFRAPKVHFGYVSLF